MTRRRLLRAQQLTIIQAARDSDRRFLCSANSGSSSRRPARCASPRCSSSRRCGPTCSPDGNAPRRRRAAAGDVDAGNRCRPSRVYADAAKKAMPAVVNIYTSKEMRQRSPLVDDPLLRRYFPDLADARAAPARDQPRLGRHRVARRLRADQPPRDRGRRRHPARAGRRAAAGRACPRHRSRIRPRGAEGRRRKPAGDHASAHSTVCRSATSCSRSAIRSASATR